MEIVLIKTGLLLSHGIALWNSSVISTASFRSFHVSIRSLELIEHHTTSTTPSFFQLSDISKLKALNSVMVRTTYLFQTASPNKFSETKVTSLTFAPTDAMTATEIHFASTKSGATGLIHIEPHDICFLTLGSMTSCSSLGTNTTPPKPLPTPEQAQTAPDGSWQLWASLANPTANPQHYAKFGNPSNFYTRVEESNWLSFTVTLNDPSFIKQYEDWSGNKAGTGALVTFKDSNWLMSIVVPHQPHFINQPENVQVFWGYGLFPAKNGNFVDKPMAECSGEEIFRELLGHLNFPLEPTLGTSITIPCMLPYITSQFLTRKEGDRPKVIPEGSTNLALLGQYVEMERDTVFTVEYSVRAAQMAVHELMGTKMRPRDVYRGEHHVGVLVEALKMLLT